MVIYTGKNCILEIGFKAYCATITLKGRLMKPSSQQSLGASAPLHLPSQQFHVVVVAVAMAGEMWAARGWSALGL